ncbi:MAG TPA: hypothetical protein VG146_16585 [Verrucomicrobiae bacterium]|nr:hypothetical protein [Verrucomicrobiae bacterium]
MGVINAPVTIYPGGSLSPAGNGTNGTLTITGALTLGGTCQMDVAKSGGIFTVDLITGVTTLTYGGTLSLNLTGDALTAGDSFTLFNFSSANADFTNIIPVSPGPGLVWDTSGLNKNGTLKVAVPTTPPDIGKIVISGSGVIISGTGGTPGNSYYVLSTTNVALPRADWTPVATNVFDSNGNFNFTNAINRAIPAEFYMLQLP